MPADMPPPPQAGSTQGRDTTQLHFVLNVGSRHWGKILLFTLAGAFMFALYGFLEQPEQYSYEFQGEVQLTPSLWDRISKNSGDIAVGAKSATDLVVGTSIRSLSEDVVRAIVQEDLATNGPWSDVLTTEDSPEFRLKAAEVSQALRLIPEDNTTTREGRVKISAQSSDPVKARRFADMATRIFAAQNRENQLDQGHQYYAIIEKELAELRKKLDVAENREWEFRKDMGFRTRGELSEEMRRMDKELTEAEATKTEIVARLREIENKLKLKNQQLPAALGRITDSVVQDLMDDLDALLQEQLSLSVQYTKAHPEMQMLDEEIADKKQAILDAVNKLDNNMGGGSAVWEDRQKLHAQYNELQLELTSLEIRSATLDKLLKGMIGNFSELADKDIEYEQLQRETERIRKEFDRLQDTEFELRTALDRGMSDIKRVENEMTVPTRSGGRQMAKVYANTFIGALVGLLVGFGLAVMLEMMDTSIRSIEDVTNYIGLEVLGTIPEMRFGKPRRRGRRARKGTYVPLTDEDQIDACIVTQHDPKSPISEAYRTLRTNYQFATIQEKPKVLMITSAVPGEGKTTTAVNLAVTMADCGMRVLLLDTDLRRPNVHRVLKIERGPGLADVLREQIDLESVVRTTRVDNLWVVSSGRVPPNPSELIGSDRMHNLMQHFRERFDIIICDAPSVLVVTDPVLLATHTDAVLIVVSVNNARRETVSRARKIMDTATANIAGVVLNGLEASRRHYYYYYYYYDEGEAQRSRWYHNL